MATDQPSQDAAAVLDRAAALVRRGWTRQAWARTATNTAISFASNGACSWCIEGAIYRAALDLSSSPETVASDAFGFLADALFGDFADVIPDTDIARWNDAQTDAAPVVAALERAARLAREGTDGR